MRSYITVLHISDLHFVERLMIEPRGLLARMIYTPKAKPHSFSKVDAFSLRVEKLKKEEGRQIDLVLGTGDLTTNGNRQALTLVRKFVDDKDIVLGDPGKPIIKGLGATKDRRLLLPGNHDRYDRNWLPTQTWSNTFEKVLDTPRNYPYVVGYRPSNLPNQESEPALLFFVFDSTPSRMVAYNPLTLFAVRKFKPWELTARGYVGELECKKLVELSHNIINSRTVNSLDGKPLSVDFHSCIRIAVLHHHPFDKNVTTLMDNNELFMQYCFRAGIDCLLFGHDHKKYIAYKYGSGPYDVASVGTPHRLNMFCCPSTSEYSAKNGFYVFEFHWNRNWISPNDGSLGLNFELYEWDTLSRDFIQTKNKYVPFNRTF